MRKEERKHGRVIEETRCPLPPPLPLITLGINQIKELVLSKQMLEVGQTLFVASVLVY